VPSGKVHDQITVVTAVAAVPVWWLLTPAKDVLPLIITLAAYIFSGLWFSHDLDTNSVPYKRWGAFRWIWLPYRKLVPHRSWISHGTAVGPLVRVVYFLFMLWIVSRAILWVLIYEGMKINRDVLLGTIWNHTLIWTFAHPTIDLWLLIGLVLGGVTHSAADTVVSFAKKVW
jgi:uncharacterized metal-binding protein